MPKRARSYPRILRFDVAVAGRSKSIVIMSAKAPQRFEIVCCCELKRDEEGRCRHLRAYLPHVKPWYLQRTTICQPVAS